MANAVTLQAYQHINREEWDALNALMTHFPHLTQYSDFDTIIKDHLDTITAPYEVAQELSANNLITAEILATYPAPTPVDTVSDSGYTPDTISTDRVHSGSFSSNASSEMAATEQNPVITVIKSAYEHIETYKDTAPYIQLFGADTINQLITVMLSDGALPILTSYDQLMSHMDTCLQNGDTRYKNFYDALLVLTVIPEEVNGRILPAGTIKMQKLFPHKPGKALKGHIQVKAQEAIATYISLKYLTHQYNFPSPYNLLKH